MISSIQQLETFLCLRCLSSICKNKQFPVFVVNSNINWKEVTDLRCLQQRSAGRTGEGDVTGADLQLFFLQSHITQQLITSQRKYRSHRKLRVPAFCNNSYRLVRHCPPCLVAGVRPGFCFSPSREAGGGLESRPGWESPDQTPGNGVTEHHQLLDWN